MRRGQLWWKGSGWRCAPEWVWTNSKPGPHQNLTKLVSPIPSCTSPNHRCFVRKSQTLKRFLLGWSPMPIKDHAQGLEVDMGVFRAVCLRPLGGQRTGRAEWGSLVPGAEATPGAEGTVCGSKPGWCPFPWKQCLTWESLLKHGDGLLGAAGGEVMDSHPYTQPSMWPQAGTCPPELNDAGPHSVQCLHALCRTGIWSAGYHSTELPTPWNCHS